MTSKQNSLLHLYSLYKRTWKKRVRGIKGRKNWFQNSSEAKRRRSNYSNFGAGAFMWKETNPDFGTGSFLGQYSAIMPMLPLLMQSTPINCKSLSHSSSNKKEKSHLKSKKAIIFSSIDWTRSCRSYRILSTNISGEFASAKELNKVQKCAKIVRLSLNTKWF